MPGRRYEIIDFANLEPVPCSCGTSRRGLADIADFPATVHVTEVAGQAEAHYHKRLTETYYVLECESGAVIELDGDRHPLRPGMCVLIRPGVRHRAIGNVRLLNIVLPKFDPSDEWFD